MAFVPAPNCAEAIINWDTPGGRNLNVCNFKFAGSYIQDDIDALAAAVDSAVGTDMLPLTSGDSAYVGTHVRGLAATVDLEALNVDSIGAGTAMGGGLPTNASHCISLRTGLTGRSARGRFYTVGMATSAQASADAVSVTYSNAYIDALENMSAAAALEGWTFVVLSRQNNGIVLTTAVARPITTMLAVDLNIDSQRRRLAGRGM